MLIRANSQVTKNQFNSNNTQNEDASTLECFLQNYFESEVERVDPFLNGSVVQESKHEDIKVVSL